MEKAGSWGGAMKRKLVVMTEEAEGCRGQCSGDGGG